MTGVTVSTNFPVQNPFQGTSGGGSYGGDAFVTKINAAGSALIYSSYLGAENDDFASDIAVDRAGNAYVAGGTDSVNFPVQGAFQPTTAGTPPWGDAFVSKLDILPLGVTRYGTSTHSCRGAISTNVTDTPAVASSAFAITSHYAPPQSPGVLLVGAGPDESGTSVVGITVHVNLARPLILIPVASGASGHAQIPISFPAATVGGRIFAQFVWVNTAACGGAGTLSASDALEITVQP